LVATIGAAISTRSPTLEPIDIANEGFMPRSISN
jgi:hypothetical protein